MPPLISVIIPVFNRLSFLKKTVSSVFKQTFGDYELIVVDDGSTDAASEWLSSKNINGICISHSGRPGLVRNRGAEISKGSYLAFLDSDDLWRPEKLERQIDYFRQNPDIEICHTREIWNRSGKIISQAGQKHKRSGDIFADALGKCIIGPSTVMLTKQLFDSFNGFSEELEIAEDYELWLRITANKKIGYIDIPLVEKNGGHPDQLSEKYGHIEVFRIQALQEALGKNCFQEFQKKKMYQTLRDKCTIYAQGALKRGKETEYKKYMDIADHYKEKLQE